MTTHKDKMIHPCNCKDYNGGQCYNCLNGAHDICESPKGCKTKRSELKAKYEAVASEGLGVEAKKLKWKPVEPEIFHDEECYNANIEIVMCNEDKAYYEVARFRDRDLLYYKPSFWYGNQGGHMKYERYDTKEEAMLRCQEHYNSIIQENIVHEAQTKYKKELLDKAGER